MPRGECEHWYEQTAILTQNCHPRVGGEVVHCGHPRVGSLPLWSP